MQFTIRRRLAAAVLASLALAGCGVAPQGLVTTDKTVRAAGKAGDPFALMTFFALDNDLDHGTGIVNELNNAAARSTRTTAVTLYDGARDQDSVLYHQAPARATLQKTAAGEVDTGAASGLSQFMSYGAPKTGGMRRVLSMADHGGGIIRGICSDWNGPGGKKIIHLPEVAGVLASNPVDIMVFDACFMGMAEVAYELRSTAAVTIGAQTTTQGDFPYAEMITTLDQSVGKDSVATSRALLEDIAESARYTVSLSAVDNQKTTELAAKMKALVGVLTPKVASKKRELAAAIAGAQAYAWETEPGLAMYNNYRDLGDVMEQLKGVGDPEIARAATEVQAAAKACVIAESHRGSFWGGGGKLDKATGLAIYAVAEGPVEAKYLTRSWNKDTGWGDFMVKLVGGGSWGAPVQQDKYPQAFPSKK